MFIPVLQQICRKALESGKEPIEILDNFFSTQTDISAEKDKIDFMFRVIQYVERQIVLYDSVEDAAFPSIQKLSNDRSLKDFVNLSESKSSLKNLSKLFSEFSARIVLTAHPTQFYTHSVLDIIDRLRTLIDKNNINEIDLTLQQLGLTSLVNVKKPTPIDEAKHIIYFLRNVYYDAVGDLYSNIKRNINDPEFENPDIIKIGFWPGGDRDGNPFVTSDTTASVANELRMALMKCYYKDIRTLEHKLTFRDVEEIIVDLRTKIYSAMFDSSKIISYDDIINPLNKIKKIISDKYNNLYNDLIENLIDKVKIFRTHFAVLDIRQDHNAHYKVMEEILKKKKIISNNLKELSEKELLDILLKNNFTISPDDFDDHLVKDTLHTILQLKQIQKQNGEAGCNRYIISNSEDIFSVLFVLKLFMICGWEKDKISFDFVPLFESMDGMKNAEAIMKTLFEIPEYRKHLKQRGNTQTIMLGFSDGTKDGGYLKANWSIFKTKEILSELCDQYKIKVIFFDGRGGPPARGGGKTHKFYAAQSDRIADHEIQLTIQGQTITSKYGTKEHFIHNSEQLITAGLLNKIFAKNNIIQEKDRKLIEELAEISFKKYTSLKNHKKFLPYLENKSTLKYYGQTNIGSRPAKRGNNQKLELKDLRAISFVGSWSQLKQNVPGYYGVGTALKSLADKGKLNELKRLFKDVPFFKALMLNSMMSLSKCYFELTSYFQNDNEYKDFWKLLFDEYKLSKEMLLKISEFKSLMEEEPVSKNSIEIRERIVLPLLVIQQYALQKIERNSEQKKIYEKIVRRSLYGNINASRNSA
jgi:phosphoenolpyruvate carboxylase